MATSKNIPRRLVSDTDEKMLQPSDMVDALNVTISDDGKGTNGVIKNVRGTDEVHFGNTNGLHDDAWPLYGDNTEVIGTVEDHSRGHIYFFVSKHVAAINIPGQNEDAIYRYSKDDGYFVEVIKTDMGFHDETNITANVVNGYFSQTTDLETIIYFTGDSLLHPPRKINADRAIAGDYDIREDLSDEAKNILLSAAKPPVRICPKAVFDTDTTLGANNFLKETFQFATQLIYKDGEVSAISPYSKLVFSASMVNTGIDSPANTPRKDEDNVCLITTGYSQSTLASRFHPDVKLLRIVGRNGNNSEMFVIDEFDPNKSITRKVFNQTKEVYNHHSGVYKFYNDSAYRAVDQDTVLKPYDNVPKYAMGQTISGNRLTYSYYKEGYDNGDLNGNPVEGTLTERFGGRPNRVNVSTANADSELIITPQNGLARIDLEASSNISSTTEFVYDDNIIIEFDLQLPTQIDAYRVSNNSALLYGFVKDSSGNKYGGKIGYGSSNADNEELILSDGGTANTIKFELAHKFASFHKETGTEELVDELIDVINDNPITATFTYTLSGDNAKMKIDYVPDGATTFSAGDRVDFVGTVNVDFELEASEHTTTKINVRPRIKRVWGADMQPDSDESNAASGEIFNGTNKRSHRKFIFGAEADGAFVDYTFIPSTPQIESNLASQMPTIPPSSRKVKIRRKNATSTFKTGSSHDIGIVYFDEFNRPGFVNKIGSFYSQGNFEKTQQFNTQAMASLCEVHMTSSPPSWAKSFQFVYPGMGSFSRMYTTSVGETKVAFDRGHWNQKADNTVPDTDSTDPQDPATVENPRADINFVNPVPYISKWKAERMEHLRVDLSTKLVYINVTAIDELRSRKGTEIDYTFQKGDIVRVLFETTKNGIGNGDINTYERMRALSNGAIEFRVVDQVTLYDDENNPLYPTHNPSSGKKTKMSDEFIGRFLVCEAAQVNKSYFGGGSNIEKYGGNNSLQDYLDYVNTAGESDPRGQRGFDWFVAVFAKWFFPDTNLYGSGAGFENGKDGLKEYYVNYTEIPEVYGQNANALVFPVYADGRVPDKPNWPRCVIEILTPSEESSNRVWYEIGECHDISKHGDRILLTGDAHLRLAQLNQPYLGYFNPNVPNAVYNTGISSPISWGFNVGIIESSYVSDYFANSLVWSKGRTHLEVKNDGERFYKSSIVHSDEYQSDINILTLASFNPAKANFFNFDKKYGSLYYIGDYNDRLIGLQQQKVSLTTVNKNVISYADGSGSVSVSENPFGSTMYASADLGLSDPFVGSVVNTGSAVYFVDYDREEIGMVQGNSVVSISDIGMRSEFEVVFGRYKAADYPFNPNPPTNIISGYDPRDQVVFFTFDISNTALSRTYGYSEKTKAWSSRYSFIPNRYATVDNRLYSFKLLNGTTINGGYYDDYTNLMHEHTDSVDRCNFYSTQYGSSITLVVNAVPGKVKVFDALSLETDSDAWVSPEGGVTTDLGSSGRIRSFEAKEGVRYAAFGRDEANNVATLIPIGKNVDAIPSVIDANTGSITFNNKLDRLPIRKGMIVGPLVNGTFVPLSDLTIKKVNGKELTFNNYGGASYAANQYEWFASQSTNEINGDAIRGAWAKVKINNTSTSQYELYAINTHISDSPNHYG